MKPLSYPKDALQLVLARAAKSPFYRERLPPLVPNYEAWKRIPLTTKSELRGAYPWGLLAVPRETLASYHESSGTSGEPTSSYFTERDWDAIASRFVRNGAGIGAKDMILIKTPYSMVTTAHQMHRAARSRGALVVPADNRSSNMPYSKVVRLLKDLPITLAWCLPTETFLWAAAARLAGLDPAKDFPRLRAFLVAGEPLSSSRRRRIEELWGGLDVFQDYGSTETGSLAGECRHKRLHPWADQVFFELVDGRLVITPLDREAMPLVRYLIDDRAEFLSDACPCGSPYPALRIWGRSETSLQAMDLEEEIYSLPREMGVSFWRARRKDSAFDVEIEVDAKYASDATYLLGQGIRRRLGPAIEVRALNPFTIVPREVLERKASFLKPQFVFEKNDDWNQAILY